MCLVLRMTSELFSIVIEVTCYGWGQGSHRLLLIKQAGGKIVWFHAKNIFRLWFRLLWTVRNQFPPLCLRHRNIILQSPFLLILFAHYLPQFGWLWAACNWHSVSGGPSLPRGSWKDCRGLQGDLPPSCNTTAVASPHSNNHHHSWQCIY